MLMRIDRNFDEIRQLTILPNIAPNAQGSVLIECGQTKVICAAMLEEKLPPWMKKQGITDSGWVSAEYSMLPYATNERKQREISSGKRDSRSVEIQRILGRSLRAVVDLKKLKGYTLWIDCDVLQADGGTRTTSISGAYVAAKIAVNNLISAGKIHEDPFVDSVAAISVGICQNELLLDLDYNEDSTAEVDLNVVMSGCGKFIELQGTAERNPFCREQLDELLVLAAKGIEEIKFAQQKLLDFK